MRCFLYLTAMASLCLFSCNKSRTPEPPPPVLQPSNNALLSNPQSGNPFSIGTIDNFTFASNNNDVVLIIANNTTGKLYAIDVQDNDAAQSTTNVITTISGFKVRIAQSMGVSANQIEIKNMEINPVSKAVYLLVYNNSNSASSLLKVTGGTNISPVNLNNVSYTAITFTTNVNGRLQDMTWGENELYVSIGSSFGLGGAVGKVGIPFTHNSSITTRGTTVFTHGRYTTDAPLEKMVYGKVKGDSRLMGVTTCAPGFSFKTSELNTSGLLQVKEYFDLDGGQPKKVISVMQGNNTYLVELHDYDNRIVRIGEKFIDESQTDNNINSKRLLTGGARTTGLTDEDIKIYNGVYLSMAKYSETQVLVIDNTDQLKLLTL